MVTRYWLRYYLISFIVIAILDVIVSSIIEINIPFFYIIQIIIIFTAWYFISPLLMILLLKMKKSNSEIYNIVSEVSNQFKLKTPHVYVSYVNFPNALAFGNIFFRGMAITEPLMSFLNDEEIKAVIAHELSHLKNHDPETLILTLIGISSIYSFLIETFPYLTALILLLYFFGFFPLFFAIHRYVERRADITAVKQGNYAIPLQTALIKIAYLSDKIPYPILKNFPEFQILFMKYDIMNESSGIGLFATHPSISERLRYLSKYE
ncbi:M48 family metalloprotease [Acidianus sulfidivorans JP7]|uniref:Heat-shock protein HspX n=1 Tax=Acidianus sulfidivorans JP7 TaxID=619593 RepID=A0A2U9INA3_9CREN|nr:M56 family metallopeptidase [Acidianus sulfidivorans]AWR97491.1 M48 family metalloprotease [Acidianus sulfidivorans JP7]